MPGSRTRIPLSIMSFGTCFGACFIAFFIACLWACSACNGERRLLSSSSATGESADPPAAAAAPARDESEMARAEEAPPPVDESVARALLARQFRAAGFRIRYDIRIGRADSFELTVDGFDPDSGVGFEYVDPAERDTDLDPVERVSLGRDQDYRILIVDPGPAEAIEERAAQFLATVERPE